MLNGGLGFDQLSAHIFGEDGETISCGAYMVSQSGTNMRTRSP